MDRADDAVLADRLGVAHISVMAVSGGGPDAAVWARFLPNRIQAAAVSDSIACERSGRAKPETRPFLTPPPYTTGVEPSTPVNRNGKHSPLLPER